LKRGENGFDVCNDIFVTLVINNKPYLPRYKRRGGEKQQNIEPLVANEVEKGIPKELNLNSHI